MESHSYRLRLSFIGKTKKRTTWYCNDQLSGETCLHEDTQHYEREADVNHGTFHDGINISSPSESDLSSAILGNNLEIIDTSEVVTKEPDQFNEDAKAIHNFAELSLEIREEIVEQLPKKSLIQKKLIRRGKLLQELVETESSYVEHLRWVVDGYINMMKKNEPYPMPSSLADGKYRIMFGNIEAIYDFHKNFMVKELARCLDLPSHLCYVFEKFLKKLNLYAIYSQNKSKSEFIVSQYLKNYLEDIRVNLGHQLRLPDLLIKPIQRLMKYELILSSLTKCTEEAGILEEVEPLKRALDSMRIVPRTTNEMMILSRVMGYEGSIMNHGKLIRQGFLWIASYCPQDSPSFSLSPSLACTMKKRYVFLFEQIIIFCKVTQDSHFTHYIYKFHLTTTRMTVHKQSHPDNRMFEIRCSQKHHLTRNRDDKVATHKGSNLSRFICRAESAKDKEEWFSSIDQILNFQSLFIRALVSPLIYQKSLETFVFPNSP